LFTIDLEKYLALADSSADFLQDCRFLKYLRIIRQESKDRFRLRDYHPLWFRFPADFANEVFVDWTLLSIAQKLITL